MSIDSVYAQIDEQRGVLVELLNQSAKNPLPPTRVSDVCMKLSILNELLGGFVSELKRVQLEKESTVYLKALEDGKSATAAAGLSRVESREERYAFDKADMKHTDLWKLISMAQSHIRAETQEQRGM